MNSLKAARTLGIARTGLAIAAVALIGCSADDQSVASLATTATAGEYCVAETSPHVLFLEDAAGNEFQLVHSLGQGWKYLSAPGSGNGEGDHSAWKADLSPVATARAQTTARNVDPMAVFIDGPTGYTFAWNVDTGWTFVGHISDSSH